MLLLFIRWVVSIRWAFFKNLFGCGLSALCVMPFYRLLLDKTQKKNEIPMIKNKKPRFSLIGKNRGRYFQKR